MTQDRTTERPGIGADLETKRQFLVDFRSEDPERRRRATELVFPQRPAAAAEAEPIFDEELHTALEGPATLQAVQDKAAELQAATQQRLRQAAEANAHSDATAMRAQPTSRPSGHTGAHPGTQQLPPPAAPPQQGPRP